jgi:hypothetical protein
MDLEDIRQFQVECIEEFQERLQRFSEWEKESQQEFLSCIWDEDL